MGQADLEQGDNPCFRPQGTTRGDREEITELQAEQMEFGTGALESKMSNQARTRDPCARHDLTIVKVHGSGEGPRNPRALDTTDLWI